MTSKLIILDIEASGLSERAPKSYPVEFGWSDLDLNVESFLIRPTKGWLKKGEWSPNAEGIHGISQQQLLDEGISVVEAAERVNAAFEGCRVLRDGMQYDPFWYGRLFEAAGIKPVVDTFSLDNALRKRVADTGASALVIETGPEAQYERRLKRVNDAIREVFTYDHRAGNDAEYLAARFRCMIDESFLVQVEARARANAVESEPEVVGGMKP